MLTKFQDELQSFLMPYDISIETPIFNDFVREAIGIPYKDNDSFGFDFGSQHKNSDDFFDFWVPLPISITDYQKILSYFGLPLENAVICNSLKISKAVLFEKVWPNFKADIELQSQQDSPKYNMYLVKSKAILESMAIGQINKALGKLLSSLNNIENVDTMSKKDRRLSRLLFAIQAPLGGINGKPHYHKYLIRAVKQLDNFFKKHPDMRQNALYKADIDMLYDGLKNYTKYCRAESSIAAINFKKHMNNFLQFHHISANYCDIVEETLLKMAGITSTPNKSTFDIGSDNTRIVFKITGISIDEANQWVEFFKSHGDNTAKVGNGYQTRAHFIPEHAVRAMMAPGSFSNIDKCMELESCVVSENFIKPLETHSIEVDAKILYDIIYPKFKETIDAWSINTPIALQTYQEKCCVPMLTEGFTKVYSLWKKSNSKHPIVAVLKEFIEALSTSTAKKLTPENILTMMRSYKEQLANIMIDANMNFNEERLDFWPDEACKNQFILSFSLLTDYCAESVSSLTISCPEGASIGSHVSIDNNDSAPSSPNRYSQFQPPASLGNSSESNLSKSF